MTRIEIYLKSTVAGILALLVFVAVLCAIAIGALFIANGAVGFDIPVVHVHKFTYAALILVFAAGFYWRLRHLSHPQRSGGIR